VDEEADSTLRVLLFSKTLKQVRNCAAAVLKLPAGMRFDATAAGRSKTASDASAAL
jgi:hypothetical protein